VLQSSGCEERFVLFWVEDRCTYWDSRWTPSPRRRRWWLPGIPVWARPGERRSELDNLHLTDCHTEDVSYLKVEGAHLQDLNELRSQKSLWVVPLIFNWFFSNLVWECHDWKMASNVGFNARLWHLLDICTDGEGRIWSNAIWKTRGFCGLDKDSVARSHFSR